MKRRTKAELLAWIEQHQPVTREKLLDAFEDMDYEQLQRWLSELQLKRKLFEINPETYYTTIEPAALYAAIDARGARSIPRASPESGPEHSLVRSEGHDSGAANHIRVPELVFESALQRPGNERQTA
jgi:hypothetical protein